MSKLDDILDKDGTTELRDYVHPVLNTKCKVVMIKPEVKQQIKDLFLEIVGSAENIFQSRDELITRKQRFDELRKKVEEL